MQDLIDHLALDYGFLGFLCLAVTVVMIIFLWLVLSVIFIFPAFIPPAFIAWATYKHFKDGNK